MMALADRAKENKRIKGKSIRCHADEHDLLKRCRVYKIAGRWRPAAENWLKPLLVTDQTWNYHCCRREYG